MIMSSHLLRRFGATTGAWAEVTLREIYDSQITLTGSEQALVEAHFAGNIHVGNVRSNPSAASKTFWLHPIGARIRLNLVYPKPARSELRLYLRERSFKPKYGDVWFIYNKNDDLHVGSMSRDAWENL